MLLPLASAADMAARDISPDRYTSVSLAVASAVVRGAAGVPISATTATIATPGTWGCYLDVPGPVTAATTVTIDGDAVSDFVVWPAYLYRAAGWGSPASVVVMTLTTGSVVPEDIIQLVCELAVLVSASSAVDPRVASESVDDYQVSYRGDAAMSTIELPKATRDSLRARFASSPVTGVR
jgi:hypothetical protein